MGAPFESGVQTGKRPESYVHLIRLFLFLFHEVKNGLREQWKKKAWRRTIHAPEGHQQSEASGYRHGLKERESTRRHEEARLRTARRSGDTEGQASSRRGSNQEHISCHLQTAFSFKQTEVQSRTKFLNEAICGLSNRLGSEEVQRSHGRKRQSWEELLG